jgi:muramoyltetrapeptide carboxypeptidase
MKPRRLVPGDLVALVAPAGPIPSKGLENGIAVLESWGLRVRVGDTVRSRHSSLSYLAATDAERAEDFARAWEDPEVAAVFAARGGYGTMRMLDLLDWAGLRSAGPKILAGSSDITALHEAVGVHLELSTLFSPMPASMHFEGEAADHLRRTLFEPEHALELQRPGAAGLVPGTASGPLIGGNLSLLVASLGAPEHRQAKGAIAVLEDVTESAYRLDRILTQLLRSGWFDGVAGIVLGSWHECGPLEDVRTMMADRLAPLGVPILWEAGFGHVPGTPTLALGVPAELDADAGILRLTEPALA